jgi:hypothetical protein
VTFPHGGPPAPPAAGSGAETILGMFRAEDYGAHSLAAGSVDASGGINLAAFTAASTGGGIVALDSGRTYQVRRPVVLPANVELVIPTGAVLQGGPGLVGDVVTATGVSGVRISGGGTIDANRAAGTTGNGVTLTNCTEPQLEQISIVNAYTDDVALVGCVRHVLDVVVGASGRHGVYHNGSSFGRGQITARDNGQRVAGSGVVFDNASTDNVYAPLVSTDTRVGGAKTQQYGVLEVAASGSDRNTYAAFALAGNATGTSSLVGPSSGPVAGAPTGAAGGDLTGNYPNPAVAAGAITTGKLAANAVTQAASAVGIASVPTTTSATFVDLTDMSVTLTTVGGDLEAWFSGALTAGINANLDVGVNLDGVDTLMNTATLVTGNYWFPFSFVHRYAAPAAGSHTVKARWRTTAGTASAGGVSRELVVNEVKR